MLVRSRDGDGIIGLAAGVPVDVHLRLRGPGGVRGPGRFRRPGGGGGPGGGSGPTKARRARGAGRPDRVFRRADDVGVPAVKLVRALSRSGGSGRSRVSRDSQPAGRPERHSRDRSRSARLRRLAAGAGRSLAEADRRGREVAQPRPAGSVRRVPWLPAAYPRGASRRAGMTSVARRAGVTLPRGVARRHRLAGPRRLPGSHAVTGWHGRRRLAAGGIRRPAGTSGVHPRLVTRTRRLSSGPAGRRPVLAPPAGLRSRRRRPPPEAPGAAGVQRSAGFPGPVWPPGVPGARPSLGTSISPPGTYTFVGFSTGGRHRNALRRSTVTCSRGARAEPVPAVPLRCAAPW